MITGGNVNDLTMIAATAIWIKTDLIHTAEHRREPQVPGAPSRHPPAHANDGQLRVAFAAKSPESANANRDGEECCDAQLYGADSSECSHRKHNDDHRRKKGQHGKENPHDQLRPPTYE
nr:hypothetical protein [Demequina sp.]